MQCTGAGPNSRGGSSRWMVGVLLAVIAVQSCKSEVRKVESSMPPETVWGTYENVVTLHVDSSAVTRELVEYVAAVGRPRTVTVREGQTVGEVIRQECGRVDPNYLQLLETSSGLPDGIEIDVRFEQTRVVDLPACLWLPQYASEQRTAMKNDSPWLYFAEEDAGFLAFDDTKAVSATVPPTTYIGALAELNSRFADTRALEEGDEILVPRPPGLSWVTLELKDDSGIVADDVRNRIETHLRAGGQDPATILFEADDQIQLYADINAPDLLALDACKEPDSETQQPPPFDPVQLVQVLVHNRSELQRLNRNLDSATIVIADTGLHYTKDLPPFSSAFVRFEHPDFWLERYASPPFQEYEKHGHGTYVATAALGGPDFMRVLGSLIGPNLKVTPINIISQKQKACPNGSGDTCSVHIIQPDAFNTSVVLAVQIDGIVNLSVGRTTHFPSIQPELHRTSRVLFVVAAGNDGRSLSDRGIYPARYGSTAAGQYNLITVAALDVDGTRAKFSNYGEDFVDIAAPGCHQPTLRYDGNLRSFETYNATGTSLAAPLVSFTAGLLRVFWSDAPPRALKRRILTGSDISDRLDDTEVADRRQLNIVKTLSLFQDVVEAREAGTATVVRGRIVSSEPIDLCGGTISLYRTGSKRNVIKKLARFTKDDFLIYYVSSDGDFKRKRCPVAPVSISITDDFTNRTFQFDERQLHDVVFAEPLS